MVESSSVKMVSNALAEMNMFDCVDKTLSDHSLLIIKMQALDTDSIPITQEVGSELTDQPVERAQPKASWEQMIQCPT